jgi:hypothetical protein
MQVDVTKLDASEIKGDIFIRDAVVAEAEVSRITGDDVGDELEEDEDLAGASVICPTASLRECLIHCLTHRLTRRHCC